jgi:antitoxin (DNA-binding transcriptional repressor) of toxin-antitoxin stability system
VSRTVSLREANQNFAKCIRAVERGEELVITRRGAPVAKLSRLNQEARRLTPAQQAARRRALKLMREGWDIGAGRLDRDALHER